MRKLISSIVALACTGAFATATAAPASANSGWRCAGLENGSLCFRTVTPSGSTGGNRISGADIMFSKTSGACITTRFYHRILDHAGAEIARWADSGSFNQCASSVKSFYWTHGGAGAYVPAGGYVQGMMYVNGQGWKYSPRIPQSQL